MNSAKYVIRQRMQPTVAPLSAAIALSLGASQIQAATITVDTLADGSIAGQCTLRDAFQAADTDAAVAGCAVGSGPDSIQFSGGLSGTINLGDPALITTSVISIAGPGAGQITVSGQGAYRLFGASTASAELTISGLTLANAATTDVYGGSAAAAMSGASLSLSDCVISGNTAGPGATGGAVAAFYATLNIDNCLFSGNSITGALYRGGGGGPIGGAVLVWGGLASIGNSSFSSNQADYAGGAIAVVDSPDTQIFDSAISGNDANFGGGVAAMRQSEITFDNNVVSGNSALAGGGTLAASGSSISGQYNTVTANTAQYDGGGILAGVVYNSGGPVAASTGNEGPAGTATPLVSGDGFTYLIDSVINDNTALRYGGGLAAKYDNSLAVTVASDVSYNQAGLPPAPFAQDTDRQGLTPAARGDNTYGGGGGMAALYGAAAYAYTDTTLYGNEAPQGGAMLAYQGGAAIAVEAVISGNYAQYGGGLQAGSTNVPAPRGVAGGDGQAIAVYSEISQNQAFAGGGLLSINGGYVSTIGSDISGNTAVIGGGFASYLGDFVAKYSNVSGNEASDYGGGIAGINCPGSAILYSTISANSANGQGGGASLDSCSAEITYSLVDGNNAYAGGGLFMVGAPGAVPQLINSTVTGNTATEAAGIAGDAVTIRSSTISHNTATGAAPRGVLPPTGGALLTNNSGTLRVNSSIFSDNSGGGTASDLHIYGAGTTYFDYSLVETVTTALPAGSGNQSGVDPLLGPLADNGGRTQTRAIGQASPAIDAGDPSVLLTYDQRGEPWPRAFNGRADIGAFEFAISEIFSDRFEGP